ncbi:MAG: hypothetical protein HY613_04470, partial [Candidatus Rokubacteria bacterium]|nr:hypothetical protein [Candidatus Rokubacteria bacterium]
MTAVLSLAVVAAFVGVWFALAERLVAWSDEITHLSAAQGLLLTGRPYLVAFDRCAALTPVQYFRGLEITWLAAQSYRLFGESLRAARSTPLLFTVLAWLAYAIYA